MVDTSLNSIQDYEKRIIFLEKRLNSLYTFIENFYLGNIDKLKEFLDQEKEESEYDAFAKLITMIPQNDSPMILRDYKTLTFLGIILENLPFPAFIKNETGMYIIVNKHEADLFGLNELEIIGKRDAEFITDQEEIEIIKKTDEEVLAGKKVELPVQRFSLPNGRSFVFKTHKIPFLNPLTAEPNILGFSIDVTDTENFEKLSKILIISSNPF